jgi:PHD/YefM family antitoxin component YafN of YafNO toxin-antitoxin module
LSIKSISSTEAQNNFGRVLDDVTLNHARYVVKRRGASQVIILSFDDFAHLLQDDGERTRIGSVLRELRPRYTIGEVIEPGEIRSESQ